MRAQTESPIVVIIGGSGGIGRAVTAQLAEQGAHVVLVARGKPALEEAAVEIERRTGRKTGVYAADCTEAPEVTGLARWLAQTYGRVDILVYAAAVFSLAPAESLDVEEAKQAMEINYWGAVRTTQALLPLIRRSQVRCIYYVSSLSVQCTPAFFTAYAASKHALRGFALALRQELRPQGIHVGILSPGPVLTPLIEGHIHSGMYRVPPGVPVLRPEAAARQIVRAIQKRRTDVTIPRRFAPAARISHMFPRLMEAYYRLTIRDWDKLVLEQTDRQRDSTPHR
ncbi:SDR family NAD(P)-dependent oxidoreductase [Alicyclobacillus shizuokensis]|uniref:SDR family NAD(P)-dependent oxidoreductase n=1 Tax=Alicyclobacillus shizuokensis TaxID=392014 RepID=UPI0008371CFC|nr:SDR family oxidoreductase [Alicyclobacillus shizuokensis]MCL6626832.1 SDR family oxidoreductase [Alicyclobacillus shizuokensis]